MAELKTQKNNQNVKKFLEDIENEKRKKDSNKIYQIIKKNSKKEPNMWGDAIIGFGSYHYKYKSGREGDWFTVGFSPRKNYLSLYVMPYNDEIESLMKKLENVKIGKCCINIKDLEKVDLKVLEKIIELSFKYQK